MKFAWGILPVLLIASCVLLVACSTLQTPEFVGPGQVRGPSGSPNRSPASIPNPESISENILLEWPVKNLRMTRGFMSSDTRKKRHQGIDLGGSKNSSILAAHDGTVIYTGRAFHGFGKMIIIESSQGYATFYAHLNSINVKEGQFVHSGQTIGKMGRTGRATGVHLHFELRIAEIPVDPIPYLPR